VQPRTDSHTQVSAINPTYKYLQAQIKIGAFTLWQWTQLVLCACLAFAIQSVLPLPGSWSLSVAITLAGLPAAAAIGAMSMDFDVLAYTRAWVRWARRRNRTWQPGHNPDGAFTGYRVQPDEPTTPSPPRATHARRDTQPSTPTIEELWS